VTERESIDNSVGQVLSATGPLGSVIQFTYDSFGNQTSIVRDAGARRLNQELRGITVTVHSN
jgi:YD repeat-containing protein